MGYWQTEWDRDALKRIVALLFALANLADLAAGASFLRRRRVLGILNRGETEARAFLIGMACGEPVPADALEPSGGMADLTVSLRALALMLILLSARPFTSCQATHPRTDMRGHEISGMVVRRLATLASPTPDTS